MTGLVILILSAMVAYLNIMLRRANETITELQDTRFYRPSEFLVPVRPGSFERFLENINRATPEHHSVGGTTPHMCVCGIPLEEHR